MNAIDFLKRRVYWKDENDTLKVITPHMVVRWLDEYAEQLEHPSNSINNDLHIPDVSVSLPVEKVNEARYAYASDYPSELRAGIEEAHLQGQMFVMKQLGLEIGYGNER